MPESSSKPDKTKAQLIWAVVALVAFFAVAFYMGWTIPNFD